MVSHESMDMSHSLGNLNLKAFRYGVLGVFLVCNALIGSLAVWNLGFVRESPDMSSLLGVDSYLTFVGCSGLVLIFLVTFVELARATWFVATVWFECLWVALWGIMNFTGGIALTVIASQQECTTTTRTSICVSIQVLLAFTWLCALTLIIYFAVFMFAVAINRKKDPTIWYSVMRKFPWSGTCAILSSTPPTPALPRFRSTVNTVPIIHAPKPKHARPNGGRRDRIFSYRSGLSQEYQIEHYRPPSGVQPPLRRSQVLEPPAAAAPPLNRPPMIPPIDTHPADSFVSSLYPTYMQQAIIDANSDPSRPEPALTQASVSAALHVARAPVHAAMPSSPPPLRGWPRPDIISQPATRGKRKAPPRALQLGDSARDTGISSFQFPASTAHQERGMYSSGPSSTAPSSYSPMRPVGPRRRSGSSDMTPQRSLLA